MAETITRLVPSIEVVRMVNSGTEATMSAIRLARGATGRSRIVKFEGCYHGHGDAFLVKAGSGALTFGTPTSPGVPDALADLTLTLPFNDFDAATRLFDEAGADIAGLIVEPVPGNMNCIPPREGYLAHLRELCTKHGALLIFDEVMTGFRVALGGAGALRHHPDLTLGRSSAAACRSVSRRSPRHHAADRPDRSAGRNAERQSGGNGRRACHARNDPDTRVPR